MVQKSQSLKQMKQENYFITTIFLYDGFENEIKDQSRIHQDKVLEFYKEPKTTREIMTYLGLKDRRKLYIKYMRPLLNSGKLQMTMPDKLNTKN
ncbi:MAG: Fic family protein [Clostridia bacterium]